MMPYRKIYVSNETLVEEKRSMEEIVHSYANLFVLESALIRAIIRVESMDYPRAYRIDYNALKKQAWYIRTLSEHERKHKKYYASYGSMQVLYGLVKADYGFKGNPNQLLDPEIGVRYGCEHLRRLLNRYKNLKDALAAYNGGGWAVNVKRKIGKYPNAKYVNKIYKLYKKNGGYKWEQ